MLKRLWLDEGGAILSTELILIVVILVIGLTVGMVALRDVVVGQYADLACAIAGVNPAYEWAGIEYECTALLPAPALGDGSTYAWVAGSAWTVADTAGDGAVGVDGPWGACDILGAKLADGTKGDAIGDVAP